MRCLFKGEWTRARVLWRGLFDGIRFDPPVPGSSASIAWDNIAYISPALEQAIQRERGSQLAEHNHQPVTADQDSLLGKGKIGRASGRERGWWNVYISWV